MSASTSVAAATSGGARIYYEVAGAGDPPLVLVHGAGCDHTTMALLAGRLARRQQVVNLDLRAHGLSERPAGPIRGADFAADVVAVSLAARLRRPVLVGHSMGAKVALEVSRIAPDLPSALVLLDSSILETPDYKARRRAELLDDSTRQLRVARRERMFLAGDSSPERQRLLDLMLAVPRELALAALAASDQIDTAGALRACAKPVLYVGASQPREQMEAVLGVNPHVWYGRVVGSGHFVHIDAVDQVAAMIGRFLRVALARQS